MSRNPPAAMRDGPVQPPVHCYTGKVPFATHAEAQWHAQRSSLHLWPYRCWNCRQFHLASRDNSPRRNRYHDFVIRQSPQQERPS